MRKFSQVIFHLAKLFSNQITKCLLPAPVTCTTDTPTPPLTPAPAYAESSVGPSITVFAIEFRALMSSFHSLSASQATLVREMQAIRRQMDTIQTHQAQHTAIQA